MTSRRLILTASLLLAPVLLTGQGQGGLDPASLLKPLGESWPTYSGDYTGRRYSSLTQINQATVKNLTLAWVTRVTAGAGAGGGAGAAGFGGGGGRGGGAAAPIIVGGEGTGDSRPARRRTSRARFSKSTASSICRHPTTRGRSTRATATSSGTTTGRRAAAPTSAIAASGCGTTICSWRRRTTIWCRSTRGPAKNAGTSSSPTSTSSTSRRWPRSSLAITCWSGTGDDLDAPGFLQSFDPETGAAAMEVLHGADEPGRPRSEYVAESRGGAARRRTGLDSGRHTTPRRTSTSSAPATRRRRTRLDAKGDNLYTCSLVAVNVDTGKMAWYYQTSPHDTHDWDSTQTPILIDATINGTSARSSCCRRRATATSSRSIG